MKKTRGLPQGAWILLLTILTGAFAHADLLDRVKLEDTLRGRIEDAFRIYDEKAKVFVRLDYKANYQNALPGMNSENEGGYGPLKIEGADIVKINVEVYSELDPVPAEAKETLYRVLPVDKNKVAMSFKKSKVAPVKESPKPIDSASLTGVMNEAVWGFSKNLFSLSGVMGFVILAVGFYLNSRRLREFKQQFSALTAALSELSLGGQAAPAPATREAAAPVAKPSGHGEKSQVEKMAPTSLQELFADCYWCERDAYAHWLWQEMSNEQRKSLLAEIDFMRAYSVSFMSLAPEEVGYHTHPYYLDPSPLKALSQDDLAKIVKAQNGLWHAISPLRQQSLPLSFGEKLAALQSAPSSNKSAFTGRSPLRTLEMKPTWGDVTEADELALFENPEMVPPALRPHVSSLVWLAQKDAETIQKALGKFDARALASAWIGPDEVLKKLEAQLPEKKLKLLQTYREKTPPQRRSPSYLSLVQEGIKNDAA